MSVLRYVISVFYLSTASLMVMGHSFDDYTVIPISNQLTLTAPNDVARVIVWAPPQKQFEIHESNASARPFHCSEEELLARPAWVIFVATVPVLLYLSPLVTVMSSLF